MKLLTTTFALLLIALVSGNDARAKEWRGIVPLHSTRADVERRLGTPTKSSAFGFYYSLPDEIVVVTFQNYSCDSNEGKFGGGWNVPLGVVTDIGVIPKRDYRKERFVSGNDFTAKNVNAGFVYYTNTFDGLSVETLDGKVTLLSYSPTAKDGNLRCPTVQECCIDIFPKFDEYADISFGDQIARLNNYLMQMNEMLGRGVIVVYGNNRAARKTLMKRAARAKRYLEQKRALETHRLLIIDGGYKDRSHTELHLYTIAGEVSRVYLYPEQDPRQNLRNKLLPLTPR